MPGARGDDEVAHLVQRLHGPAVDLGVGEGWRALTAWVLGVAAAAWLLVDTLRSISTPQRRRQLAEQMGKAGGIDYFDLRSGREAALFQGVAFTAGLTEEVIFRGFVMLTFAMLLPFWAAVAASAVLFVAFHAYQGVAGMVRIIPITMVLSVLVVLGGTLWPAILVHIVADMVGGIMLWGAREEWAAHREAVRYPQA